MLKTVLCIIAVLAASTAFGQDCRETIMNDAHQDSQQYEKQFEQVTEKLVASKKMTKEQVGREVLNLVANDPEISRLQKERADLVLKMLDLLPGENPCPQMEKMAKEVKRINAAQWGLIFKALERK